MEMEKERQRQEWGCHQSRRIQDIRVLLYQFMKNNKTSERKILEKVPNITIVDGLEQEKFSFQMTEEEKAERRKFYNSQFQMVTKKAAEEHYDVLFMDETIYTISAGLLDEQLVLDFLASKPENLEVILTGNTPSQKMIDAADYVSRSAKSNILLKRTAGKKRN